MRYRPLGQTGLDVSVLSFGASSLGSAFRPIVEAEGHKALHRSLDLGINLIDCSPYYGATTAETILGRGLKGIARDRYVLATKVGRYGVDQFDFSAKRITASIEESLTRMQVDHVDLLQCHDIEFVPLAQIWEETLPALERLRQQGKCRFIGITGLPLKVFREVAAHGRFDTILSYCRYSLNDTALAGELPWLSGRGIGVINASPLSMGLLSERGAPAWHPAPKPVQAACATAAAHCKAKGSDIAKLAVQFSCAHPDIASTLVGSADAANMERNIRWVDEPLDQQLLAEVLAILAPIQNHTWSSGLPENNG